MQFTLISDGSSDKALLPVLNWALVQNGVRSPVRGEHIDWGRFRYPPRSLAEKVESAVRLYPCDLLFIHRDAETAHPANRRGEINSAIRDARCITPPSICIVPVRMMEAWFLFCEDAIREASGNPTGREPLNLPRIRDVESLPDPKAVLHGLLRNASGLSGRRLRGLRTAPAIHRIAEIIDDFNPLLQLPAFQELHTDIRTLIQSNGW